MKKEFKEEDLLEPKQFKKRLDFFEWIRLNNYYNRKGSFKSSYFNEVGDYYSLESLAVMFHKYEMDNL